VGGGYTVQRREFGCFRLTIDVAMLSWLPKFRYLIGLVKVGVKEH